MKVFISYSHKDGDWVWDRLYPVLKAGGVEVLIDREQFRLGKQVLGQMDATQDQADKHIIVFSSHYLASDACKHELKRAVKTDPKFQDGRVLVIRRDDTALPKDLSPPNTLRAPLIAAIRRDSHPDDWALLINTLDLTLPSNPVRWLRSRSTIIENLREHRSVIVVTTELRLWEPLFDSILNVFQENDQPVSIVDLGNPLTYSREGLLRYIMRAMGSSPHGRVSFDTFGIFLESIAFRRVFLRNFHYIKGRRYGNDVFRALRYGIYHNRFTALVHSDATIGSLFADKDEDEISSIIPRVVNLL